MSFLHYNYTCKNHSIYCKEDLGQIHQYIYLITYLNNDSKKHIFYFLIFIRKKTSLNKSLFYILHNMKWHIQRRAFRGLEWNLLKKNH